MGEVVGPDLLLRERGRPVHRGDVQDARLRPLWDEITRERYGIENPKHAPLPLRRPGQLARADRGAAGEQRPAHRAGDARRHPVQGRPRPRRPAARPGTRRWACPGPGTSSGRCASSRCWRYESDLLEYDDIFDGLARHRGQGRRAGRGAPGRDRADPGDGRRDGRRRVRLPQVAAGRLARRAAGAGSSRGEEKIVGVNCFETTEPNPLTADLDTAIHDGRPGGRGPGRSPPCRPGASERDAAPRPRRRWSG